jgi:hypothetical protein
MDRIKEPSTWGGLSGTLASAAPFAGPFQAHVAFAAGFCGLIAIFLREIGAKK